MLTKMMHKKRIRRRVKQEIHGEAPETETIPMVKNLIQIMPVVKELNTAQYAWCRDNTNVFCG